MSFDPDALRALGGPEHKPRRPVTLPFLVRVGLAAAVAAAGCDLALLVLAQWQGWEVTTPSGQDVQALAIVAVCLVVGALSALGAYVAARVTKRPEVWVVVAGAAIWLASVQGLPRTLQAMHLITAVWIAGWLARAVLRGSHLR